MASCSQPAASTGSTGRPTSASVSTSDVLTPEAGQGIVALQVRDADRGLVESVDHRETSRALTAERRCVRLLEGGCTTPVAAYARAANGVLVMTGFVERAGEALFATESGSDPLELAALVARQPRSARMTVYLVGAGPGDPGLITVRGLDLLQRAEVVVYDRLAAPELLAEAPVGALLINAGKAPGIHSMRQGEIDATLVEHGLAGRLVVRLKGGDPFVFGRGGEEAEALAAAGVPFEVVPGVTSAVAVPAYAGIPVTHRGLATHVTIVTGHEDPTREDAGLDWGALARAGGTIVLLMGVGRLPAIAAELLAADLPADTPVAIIERGTTASQRVLRGTLAGLADLAGGARSPAVVVIGAVTSLADTLGWADRRALAGVTIAVTRPKRQASGLAARLRDLGASVIQAPLIEIEPLDGPQIDVSPYDLLCVTSPSAPPILLDRVGGDARRLAGLRIAAIGPGTARALREIGIMADVVARRAIAEGLLEALEGQVAGQRVLVARAEVARDVLPDGLMAGGATVDVVPLYRTVARVPKGLDPLACDVVTLTSASTARALAEAFPGRDLSGVRGVSIGPITSAAAREAGVGVVAEASDHTLAGLEAAICSFVRGTG